MNAITLQTGKILVLKNGGKRVLVNISDVVYIEYQKSKILVKTSQEVFSTQGNLNYFEKKLDVQCFFRCHKGYLVNLKKIKEIVPNGRTFQLVLNSGDRILLSRRREKVLRDILSIS